MKYNVHHHGKKSVSHFQRSWYVLIAGAMGGLFLLLSIINRKPPEQPQMMQQSAAPLTVMTYDWLCAGPDTVSKIVAYAKTHAVDILGIQGMGDMDGNSGPSVLKDAFAAADFPMDAVETTYLDEKHAAIFYRPSMTKESAEQVRRIADRAIITVSLKDEDGTVYRVVNNHVPDNSTACNHIDQTIDWISDLNTPRTIYLGDFGINMATDAESYPCITRLQSQYERSCVPGQTALDADQCQGTGPYPRGDYILNRLAGDLPMTDSFVETAAFTVSSQAHVCSPGIDSDHAPVVATFQKPGQFSEIQTTIPVMAIRMGNDEKKPTTSFLDVLLWTVQGKK